MIIDLSQLILDDSEKVTMELSTWGIVFHTLLSHSTLVPVMEKPSPAESDKSSYSYALQTM